MLSFHLIIKCRLVRWHSTNGRLFLGSGVMCLLISACSTSEKEFDPIAHGSIDYPFVSQTHPLGLNGPEEKFVIRSAVGNREYTIEIPGAARDYDVHVPLAEIDKSSSTAANQEDEVSNPVATDAEIVSALPQLKNSRPNETSVMDGAFGVSDAEGSQQAPSYTLGISKINKYYKARKYEYALIEINNLLVFYPNSAKLLKMKGTILVKMRNFELAELAWIKAIEINPRDKALRSAVARLQKRIISSRNTNNQLSQNQGEPNLDIPTPVGTVAPDSDQLSH